MVNLTTFKLLLLNFFLFFASTCTTTKLLSTDFDNFNSNSIPNPWLSIPGEPYSDLIYYRGTTNNQTFAPIEIGNGFLQYAIEATHGPNESKLGFKGVQTNFNTGFYHYNWEMGFAPNMRRLLNIRLTAGDNYDTDIILDLEIKPTGYDRYGDANVHAVELGNRQFVRNLPDQDLEQIGVIQNKKANIFIMLDIESNQYYLQISNLDGEVNAETGFRPLPFNTDRLEKAPNLWFKFIDRSEYYGIMQLKKVHITHKVQTTN